MGKGYSVKKVPEWMTAEIESEIDSVFLNPELGACFATSDEYLAWLRNA